MAVNADTVAPYRADWRRGRVTSWLTTVDHKRIGILYIWTALLFFALGGVLALLIRAQLATPGEHFLTKNSYNQVVTMHGTTMIFLVIVPILAGFGNYLVPLMIGARDMAFPRLNAFGFWAFLFAGLLLYSSYLAGSGLPGTSAPDVGWFAYAPLTTRIFSPGPAIDYWALAILLSGVSSISSAINVIATVVSMRCPRRGLPASTGP